MALTVVASIYRKHFTKGQQGNAMIRISFYILRSQVKWNEGTIQFTQLIMAPQHFSQITFMYSVVWYLFVIIRTRQVSAYDDYLHYIGWNILLIEFTRITHFSQQTIYIYCKLKLDSLYKVYLELESIKKHWNSFSKTMITFKNALLCNYAYEWMNDQVYATVYYYRSRMILNDF